MTLEIKLQNSNCKPGQTLNGSVVWDLDSLPSKIILEVSWQTTGKGTDDSETVHSENWSPDAKSGEWKFQLLMPRGPITVQGNLISIGWQVECTSKRPKATHTMPFVLSHLDHVVQLTSELPA